MLYLLLIPFAALLWAVYYWLFVVTEGLYLGQRVVVWLYDWYAPRYDGIKQYVTEEEQVLVVEPLLGELGLLQEVHKGQYAFRRGPKASLNDGVFAYALVDYWNRAAAGQSSLAFEAVAYAEGSPGRVFKLDEESIAQRLITLSDFTGRKLEWTDSAGLRQVHRKDLSKEDIKSMIRRAYD